MHALTPPRSAFSFWHGVIPTSYFDFILVYIGLHVSAFKGTGSFFIMHSILLVYRKRPGAVYREQKSISERAVEHTEEDPEGGVEEGEIILVVSWKGEGPIRHCGHSVDIEITIFKNQLVKIFKSHVHKT